MRYDAVFRHLTAASSPHYHAKGSLCVNLPPYIDFHLQAFHITLSYLACHSVHDKTHSVYGRHVVMTNGVLEAPVVSIV
ncbi:hypothetical protein E2C01_099207 [Portunus trituberculatus]|uniref:Uncharacterized protein n=1 Tax=Portunus trituberculatus TaxID=210409 RepID=A0A5B7K9R0_PORTR|nr:hypothetical protein [Portunus trituberculatus]